MSGKGKNSTAPAVSFETILRESLFRGNSYKATCPLCKQFTINESRKSISSTDLPAVLAFNTSVYESGIATHRTWIDSRGRQEAFVKPFVNIRGQVDGIDENETIGYELRVGRSLL